MACPVCRSENPAGAKFCKDCGTRLSAACPSCGSPTLPDAKFCNECGSVLGAAAAPSPESRPAAASRGDQRARRRAPSRHGPVRRPRRLHAVRRGARRGGGPRGPDPLLRHGARDHRCLRRRRREVHRRRGDGRLGRADRAGGRCRAGGPHRARPRRGRPHAGPDHPGTRRRPDRRGGRHHRCHEPGDGRGRHRQHRGAPPVGRGAGHGPRRRGNLPGGVAVDRLRTCRRAGAEGQDQPGPGVASPARHR